MVGLFHEDNAEHSGLLAFAWGCVNGNCVQYTAAASTRRYGLRIPLGYALAWDLITWGKDQGAEFFDFGGITGGTYGDRDDPLGGASDFKRYFTTKKVHVGSEWIYEPRPALAKIGDVLSAIAQSVNSTARFKSARARTEHEEG